MSKKELKNLIGKAMAQEQPHDIKAQIEKLREENAALQLGLVKTKTLTFKVTLPRAAGTNGPTDRGTQGGAVSVYGLGRFPVTLYWEQWEYLFQAIPQLQEFIKANTHKLAVK